MWWALQPADSEAVGLDCCPPSTWEVRIIVNCILQRTFVTLDTAWTDQDHCGNLTWVIQRNVKHFVPSVIWREEKKAEGAKSKYICSVGWGTKST